MRARPSLLPASLLPARMNPLGRLVLIFCFGTGFVLFGLGQVFTVFFLPLEREFGADRAAIAVIFSISMLVSGLASPLVGELFDRVGPRVQYTAGFALSALGYALASQASEVWHLYLALGLIGGAGGALAGGVPHSALVSRWFSRTAGSAIGIVFSAGGLATVAIAPLAQLAIEAFGWRSVYLLFSGAVALLVPLTLAMPWGRIMRGGYVFRRAARAHAAARAEGEAWTMVSALRTHSFWGLFSVYFFTGGATTTLAVFMVTYLVSIGFAPLTAAALFGFAGFLTPFGMIGFGTLGDRIGRGRAALLSFVATGLAIAGLGLAALWPSLILIAPAMLLFGVSSGSRGPIVSAIAINMFAGGKLGGIYGAISLGGGLGAAFGAWFGGAVQDWTGSPLALIAFCSVFLFLGAMPFWTLPALKRS